jgi:O-antigen ligase
VAAFTIVIIYTLVRHAGYGLDNQVMSHSVMKPFYKDHTSYGAVLALLIPVLLGLFSNVKKERVNLRLFMILLIGLFVMAIIFSYTRAAWLGLIVAGGLWLVIILKIPFRYVTIGALVVLGLFFSLRTQILMNLEKNRQQSSGNITEHVQSMTNVRNDQSNLERINRWSCAVRMWKEKPVFGFGPGTYQFEYARFQRSYEKTLISTNFGTRGNAHSEYLGPLAESGLIGMVSILIVLATTIMTGLRVYYTSKNKAVKRLALAILLALISYYVHGFMNNFLDTDKVSALFWGFTAMLVAMDLYTPKSPKGDFKSYP